MSSLRTALLVLLWVYAGAGGTACAHPEGAPWETAGDAEGCTSCHFDSPDPEATDGLTLGGLPKRAEAGRRYELLLGLDDDALMLAGFLLTVTSAGGPAGDITAVDSMVEAIDAAARSTKAGSEPATAGRAEWQFVWTAPPALSGPVTFDVWANAANDDLSPFGDRSHHRVWSVPVAK